MGIGHMGSSKITLSLILSLVFLASSLTTGCAPEFNAKRKPGAFGKIFSALGGGDAVGFSQNGGFTAPGGSPYAPTAGTAIAQSTNYKLSGLSIGTIKTNVSPLSPAPSGPERAPIGGSLMTAIGSTGAVEQHGIDGQLPSNGFTPGH